MNKITNDSIRALKGPNQIFHEWKTYLKFLQIYCKHFNIEHPIVVEVGVQSNRQKAHYEKFLDAVHIGIDAEAKFATPDILGNSHDPKTLERLVGLLNKRPINILFLDASHTYADTSEDFDDYGALTQDIIALHDIRHEKEIGRLWYSIQKREKANPWVSFLSIGAWGNGWAELGIGVLVKHSREELKEVFALFRAETVDG